MIGRLGRGFFGDDDGFDDELSSVIDVVVRFRRLPPTSLLLPSLPALVDMFAAAQQVEPETQVRNVAGNACVNRPLFLLPIFMTVPGAGFELSISGL
jgi:hypothetical protein